MRWSRLAPLVGFAAMTLACYQPELAPGKYKCDRDDQCPEGQVCAYPTGASEKRCVLPGEGGGGGGGGDGGSTGEASPCSAEGTQLQAGVWACRGDFNPIDPRPESLCKSSNYEICNANNKTALSGLGDRCDKLRTPGFFASAVGMEGVNENMGKLTGSCNPQRAENSPYAVVGCGSGNGVKLLQSPCAEMSVALRCDQNSSWDCRTTVLFATHKNTATEGGGVLCCKKN